jgi:hypothetical protein
MAKARQSVLACSDGFGSYQGSSLGIVFAAIESLEGKYKLQRDQIDRLNRSVHILQSTKRSKLYEFAGYVGAWIVFLLVVTLGTLIHSCVVGPIGI